MVDFNAAVAAVQDPNADPVFLARIAYENPEFGANVVANPRAYPGLKRWVAQFGDERARQQLMAMGWPVPQTGVQQQMAAGPVTAQTPMEQQGMEPGAERQRTEQFAPSTPVGANQEAAPQNEYNAAEAAPANTAVSAHETGPDQHADVANQHAGYDAQTQAPDNLVSDGQLSDSQFSDNTENQYITPAQASPIADANETNGYTAEIAMHTDDQMLMARIAGEAPELRPALARNPNIYPELLEWLGQLNDSAINAAIRSRQ